MASKLSGIELTRYDDLFKTDAEREADRQERIQIVPAAEVFPYSRQPYTIDRPTPDLVRLMDSIEHIGIAEPLIVRPREIGGYEIISGHRRDYCAKAVGLDTRPVIVRNYSDEEADILVVDYNINREDLLPSEKAKAYKLKLDAMKRQAGRPSKNSGQVGQDFRGKASVDILAEQADESRKQVQRYIRLNKLIPPLLDAVDAGTLKFVPAADFLSHLSEKEQTYLLLVMERDEVRKNNNEPKKKQGKKKDKSVSRHEEISVIWKDNHFDYTPDLMTSWTVGNVFSGSNRDTWQTSVPYFLKGKEVKRYGKQKFKLFGANWKDHFYCVRKAVGNRQKADRKGI